MGCYALLQGTLPTQGTQPTTPASPALAGGFFTASAIGCFILESENVFKNLKRTKLFITELAGESTLADLATAVILSELLKKIIQVKHYLQGILTLISLF